MGTCLRRWLPLVVVLLASNVLLAAYIWIPDTNRWLAIVPLPETVVLAAILAVWGDRRAIRFTTGFVLGVLLGFSLVEGAFQYIYGRPFAPRIDIQMISGLLYLLFGEIGELADVLRPAVFLLIVAICFGVGVALATLQRKAIIRARVDRSGLIVGLSIAAVVVAVSGPPRSLFALSSMAWFDEGRTEFVDYRPNIDAVVEGHDNSVTPPEYAFPGIKDRDIYIFAVEAYGYATFSRHDLKALVDPARNRFAEALRDRGYGFRSAFLESPVAGGFSWLAEATFLTGQWIDSQNAFLQLYDAGLPTLTGTLHEGGYYTFTVKPGTVHAAWPEGWEIYRFEESMVAFDGDFGYVGPWFSYVPVTDQYTLWAADRRIRELRAPDGAAASRPLLAYYQLVSSHTPFNKIPPIIEDWNDLGDGSVYHERDGEIRYFDNTWGGGGEMDEGYSAAISYVFESLEKYVSEVMEFDRDPIIIVFGDHQAQRPIREKTAFLSTPIHVASRDPEILALFEGEGFRPGLDGGQAPPHPPMSAFFPLFTRIATNQPPVIVQRGVAEAGISR